MNTKKLLLAIMAFVIPIFSFAYIIPENGDRGVKIGDLYYFLYEESKTATVVRGYYDWEAPNIPRPQKFYDYTGDIIIPEDVIYANDTYTVTSIEGGESETFKFGFLNTSITSIVIPKTIETMGAFFKKADVMLVALNDVLIFNLVLPAKVQAYMAAGKPILASLCGEGADIIKDANCGWSVPSNEYKELASLVRVVAKKDKQQLKELGANARSYYENNFTREKCMNILDESFKRHYKY